MLLAVAVVVVMLLWTLCNITQRACFFPPYVSDPVTSHEASVLYHPGDLKMYKTNTFVWSEV